MRALIQHDQRQHSVGLGHQAVGHLGGLQPRVASPWRLHPHLRAGPILGAWIGELSGRHSSVADMVTALGWRALGRRPIAWRLASALADRGLALPGDGIAAAHSRARCALGALRSAVAVRRRRPSGRSLRGTWRARRRRRRRRPGVSWRLAAGNALRRRIRSWRAAARMGARRRRRSDDARVAGRTTVTRRGARQQRIECLLRDACQYARSTAYAAHTELERTGVELGGRDRQLERVGQGGHLGANCPPGLALKPWRRCWWR